MYRNDSDGAAAFNEHRVWQQFTWGTAAVLQLRGEREAGRELEPALTVAYDCKQIRPMAALGRGDPDS